MLAGLRIGCRRALHAALWLTCLSASLAAAQAQLAVSRADGSRVLSLPLASGEPWCLVWRHSVAGFAVRDCFVWQPPQLRLMSSHQPDFAAGLGHVPGRGQVQAASGGGYVIAGIDEALPGNRLVLRVGAAAVDHRIETATAAVSLSALVAGERVVLSVLACAAEPCHD